MKNSAESIARGFVAAINRQDVGALAELMTPAHRFIDALANVVEGREKVRAAWVGYFRMVPDYRIDVVESYWSKEPGISDPSIPPSLLSRFALDDGSSVVLLGMARGTFAPDGALKPENRWETPVALRALIVNGKVAEWRVYADNEPMRRLMR
jgi:ketosteroid isomerase-like protein